MKITIRRRSIMLATVATALAVGASIGYAAIPGGGNVYTACMLKNVGTIRLIDPTLPAKSPMSHCTALETQVSWNQVGQPGQTGATGPTGPSGGGHTVLFANIDYSGDVVDGDATSATSTENGGYDVTFPRNVHACADEVTIGDAGGASSGNTPDLLATAQSEGVESNDGGDDVFVQLTSAQSMFQGGESDFHLVVVCP